MTEFVAWAQNKPFEDGTLYDKFLESTELIDISNNPIGVTDGAPIPELARLSNIISSDARCNTELVIKMEKCNLVGINDIHTFSDFAKIGICTDGKLDFKRRLEN